MRRINEGKLYKLRYLIFVKKKRGDYAEKNIILLLMLFILTFHSTATSGNDSQIVMNTIVGSNLEIEVVTGGIGVQAILRNNGKTNLTNITWEITVSGGLVIFGKTAMMSFLFLDQGAREKWIPLVIGFGKPIIQVNAVASESDGDQKVLSSRLRGVFLFILPGDDGALRFGWNGLHRD